jgi:hypothetical protein
MDRWSKKKGPRAVVCAAFAARGLLAPVGQGVSWLELAACGLTPMVWDRADLVKSS